MTVKAIVETPLGHRVRLTLERWSHIVRQHPPMIEHQDEVLEALRSPEKAYRGPRNEIALLRRGLVLGGEELYVVVYYRPLDEDAFVLTAHPISWRRAQRKFRKWREVMP